MSRYNPPIQIDAAFFKAPLKTYVTWKEAWWREVIQNAVDAGAKNVELTCVANADGTWHVECLDDAGGMPPEILTGKFLSIGGSSKKGTQSTGSFGRAKELIAFPWMNWAVHTRSKRVYGWVKTPQTDYEYGEEDVPHLNGTKVTVTMANDEHTSIADAIAYIKKCYLPNVRFKVTGVFDAIENPEPTTKTVKADLDVDAENLVENIDYQGKTVAQIFHLPKVKVSDSYGSKIFFRDRNGLFMWEKSPPFGVPGILVCTILAPTIDVLTDNRDGFRISSIQYSVDNFLYRLAKDTQSGLRKKKGGERIFYQGKGKFLADQRQLQTALRQDIDWTKGKAKLTAVEIDTLAETLQRNDAASPQLEKEVPATAEDRPIPRDVAPPIEFKPVLGAMKAQLEGEILGPEHLETIAKQLAWEPPFVIVPTPLDDLDDIYKVPAKFKPETMSAKLRKLARLWAELCRFVLIQINSKAEFGVGWYFSSTSQAGHFLHDDGSSWFILNPYKGAVRRLTKDAYGGVVKVELGGELLNPSSQEDLEIMFAAAIHEATHGDGYQYHDESFAAALTYNIVKCIGRGQEARVKKIQKAILARSFEAGQMEQEGKPKPKEAAWPPRGDFPREDGWWQYQFARDKFNIWVLTSFMAPSSRTWEDAKGIGDLDWPPRLGKKWKAAAASYNAETLTDAIASAWGADDRMIGNALPEDAYFEISLWRSQDGGDPE